MTQQTHPHETDGPREEHDPSSQPEQGGAPEPLWYDGPAAWHSPSDGTGSAGAARAAGPDQAPSPRPRRDSFGLGSPATTEWSAAGRSTDGASTTSWQPTPEHPRPEQTAPTAPVPTAGPDAGWHPDGAFDRSVPTPYSPATGGSGSGGYGGTPGWGGDGGWGGGTTPPAAFTPAPEKRTGHGRRWAELGVVALVAAALAGGGSYVAAKNGLGATTSSIGGSAPASASNPAAPVAQGDPSSPDWTVTAKAVSPSVVAIDVQSSSAEGQGSGVIIDAAGGYVLTNNHVATGAGAGATIQVTLSDGRTYGASIKGTDPSTDLAVLQIKSPPSDLKAISIGDSNSLVVGQPVMAVGNPLGLAGTVTTGIVSALNRPVATQAADSSNSQDPFGGGQTQAPAAQVVTNAIQTSAAINPGNSGGALVTANGQLIGINSSIASLGASSSGSQSGNIGIGFAIPSKEAKSIADQLVATGKAEHAYLGVSASDTTVTDGSSKRAAAVIATLSSGTPAAAAGLQKGDAIVAIDGQSIESSKSLVATIHEYGVGDKVTVSIIRGGAKQDISVTLAAKPTQG